MIITFSTFLVSCQNSTQKNKTTKNPIVIQKPSNEKSDTTYENRIINEIIYERKYINC